VGDYVVIGELQEQANHEGYQSLEARGALRQIIERAAADRHPECPYVFNHWDKTTH